jgi:hypothetical protein
MAFGSKAVFTVPPRFGAIQKALIAKVRGDRPEDGISRRRKEGFYGRDTSS